MTIRLFSSPNATETNIRSTNNNKIIPLENVKYYDNSINSTFFSERTLKKDFLSLGLSPWLLPTLSSLSIVEPTEIQVACIPEILNGRHVISGARTGSGKTAAFALPILTRLAEDPYGIFALILSPTRELVLQIGEQFKAFGESIRLNVGIAIGGLDMMEQASSIAIGRPHILVATPGRLADILNSCPDASKALSRLRFLVFDEADRLITETCFVDPLQRIISHCGVKRQNLFFSATLSNTLANSIIAGNTPYSLSLHNPFVYNCKESYDNIAALIQRCLFIPSQVRDVYLIHLLTVPFAQIPSIIIFVGKCK